MHASYLWESIAALQVKDAKKAKFQLGTAEPKLGAAIQEATQVQQLGVTAAAAAAAAATAGVPRQHCWQL